MSLTHPDIAAMDWLPMGIMVVREGTSYRINQSGAESERVSQLISRGWELDLTDELTAAWAQGYTSGASPLPRATVMGFALGSVSSPGGTVSHRLTDLGDGTAQFDALDVGGSVLQSWLIDSITDPSLVTPI